jgi:hypothetical protein
LKSLFEASQLLACSFDMPLKESDIIGISPIGRPESSFAAALAAPSHGCCAML